MFSPLDILLLLLKKKHFFVLKLFAFCYYHCPAARGTCPRTSRRKARKNIKSDFYQLKLYSQLKDCFFSVIVTYHIVEPGARPYPIINIVFVIKVTLRHLSIDSPWKGMSSEWRSWKQRPSMNMCCLAAQLPIIPPTVSPLFWCAFVIVNLNDSEIYYPLNCVAIDEVELLSDTPSHKRDHIWASSPNG